MDQHLQTVYGLGVSCGLVRVSIQAPPSSQRQVSAFPRGVQVQPHEAWIDESDRVSDATMSAYSMCASLVPTSAEECVRHALRQIAPRSGKLHWHDLDPKGRREVVDMLAGFDVEHLVVLGNAKGKIAHERARGRCLEKLIWLLTARGITLLTLEQRSRTQDRKDRDRIDGFGCRWPEARHIRARWVRGATEPLLCLPDVALGVYWDTAIANRDFLLFGTVATFDL